MFDLKQNVSLEQPLRLFHRCGEKPLVRARPKESGMLTDFNQICSFSRDFHKVLQHQISRKSVQWEPRWYTRRHTELTKKKLTNLMGNLCCARGHSVQFVVQFFNTVKLHILTLSVWGPLECMGLFRVHGALYILLF